MALFARVPQPPELYGILDDDEDPFEALGRYPSFHPPAGSSFSSGVVGSNTTGEVSSYLSPASAAGHSHSDYSQSKRSPRRRPSETSHEDSRPSQVSADQTEQSWFDPDVEVWKPSTSNKMRKALQARLAPQVPKQQQAAPPVMYSYGSLARPKGQPLTGILIKEPLQQFDRAKGPPRKSAMNAQRQQPLRFPTFTRSLPFPSSYPVQTPSSPSTVTDLSIKAPPSIASGWTPRWSRAETATSALNSEFGTSTSTSFSKFPSSAAFSSSSYYSHSAPRFAALDPITSEDDYPIEPPTSVPRLNLSIIDEDWPSPRARYDSDSGTTASSLEVEPTPGERIYPLPLTLEEVFKGGMHTYRVTTLLLSGELKVKTVRINIELGWEAGTRIIFRNSGDELAPGVFQTMVFVVEQIHHERFTRRKGGELMYNQNINLVDAVKDNGRREARKVVGLDGKVIEFYPPKGVINHGQETVIEGEGMYIRSKSKVVGRGDLTIRWNITFLDRVTPD